MSLWNLGLATRRENTISCCTGLTPNDHNILQGYPCGAPADCKSRELLTRFHEVYAQGSHKHYVDYTKLLWKRSPSSRPPCRPSARQPAPKLPMSTSHQCNHLSRVTVKLMIPPGTNDWSHESCNQITILMKLVFYKSLVFDNVEPYKQIIILMKISSKLLWKWNIKQNTKFTNNAITIFMRFMKT